MKRILILADGNIYERRGYFNAVINRTKHLMEISDFDIDILILSEYEPLLVRCLRKTKKILKPNFVEIEGLKMRIDWKRFSLIDYILHVKLHKPEFLRKLHNKKILRSLGGYDLVISHSLNCGKLAREIKQRYGTPYTVTWHGSDIHTEPFNNSSSFRPVVDVIESANMNFFVSNALLKTSDLLTKNGVKQVLYNGYNLIFYRYSDEKRSELRDKYIVKDMKVITFAGNFFEVKNILLVPEIFKTIYERFKNVEFWMIGGGKYESEVKKMSEGLPIRFWGNQPIDAMPEFLNTSDVLILPSKNEGLPLIVVEALMSGCMVVGSRVGGIPEVLGEDYCVDLKSPTFVSDFADMVLRVLNNAGGSVKSVDSKFDWRESATKELGYIKLILGM